MQGELGRGPGALSVGESMTLHGEECVDKGDLPLFANLGRWLGVPGADDLERARGTSLLLRKVDVGTVRVLMGPRGLLSRLARDVESGQAPASPGEVQQWSGWQVDLDVHTPEGRDAWQRLFVLGLPPVEGPGVRAASVRRVMGAWVPPSPDMAFAPGLEESVFTTYEAEGREDFVHTALLGDVMLRTRGRVGDCASHVYEATLMGLSTWAVELLRQLHPRSVAHGDTVVLVFTADEAERLHQGARDWVRDAEAPTEPDARGMPGRVVEMAQMERALLRTSSLGMPGREGELTRMELAEEAMALLRTPSRGMPDWVVDLARMEMAEEAMALLLTPSRGAALQVVERLVALCLFLGEAESAPSARWT
ncbi:hypothetical protein LY474_29815 [Myxococcus stipitatus]|uniref:hypothetical protein n=1 Tax=Myxococcus stipitatus TaxID=83455 RepID=UPI001F3020F8|nr:hypothetical protein [Myxococcus stipitatus]MCE9672011.1 hypothetical protein [Myxococcus stipitatus]